MSGNKDVFEARGTECEAHRVFSGGGVNVNSGSLHPITEGLVGPSTRFLFSSISRYFSHFESN